MSQKGIISRIQVLWTKFDDPNQVYFTNKVIRRYSIVVFRSFAPSKSHQIAMKLSPHLARALKLIWSLQKLTLKGTKPEIKSRQVFKIDTQHSSEFPNLKRSGSFPWHGKSRKNNFSMLPYFFRSLQIFKMNLFLDQNLNHQSVVVKEG